MSPDASKKDKKWVCGGSQVVFSDLMPKQNPVPVAVVYLFQKVAVMLCHQRLPLQGD